jgi:hypothetical protein
MKKNLFYTALLASILLITGSANSAAQANLNIMAGKTVMTIDKNSYAVDNFSYYLSRTAGSASNTVSGISISITVYAKNDLDKVMMNGAFSCTFTKYNDSGTVSGQLVFENVEITSFNFAEYSQAYGYVSIGMEAQTIVIDGKKVTVKTDE